MQNNGSTSKVFVSPVPEEVNETTTESDDKPSQSSDDIRPVEGRRTVALKRAVSTTANSLKSANFKKEHDPSDDIKLAAGWVLMFEDQRVEDAFVQICEIRNYEHFYLGYIMFLVAAVITFLVRGSYSWLFHSDPAARVAGWCHFFQIVNLVVVIILACTRKILLEYLAYVSAVIVATLAFPMNAFRATMIAGTSEWYDSEIVDECKEWNCFTDWPIYLCSFFAITLIHAWMESRSRFSWIPAVIIVLLGEIFNNALRRDDKALYSVMDGFASTCMLALISYFSWRGRWAMELHSRIAFKKEILLEKHVEDQDRAIQKQKSAMKALQENLDAFESVAKKGRDPSSAVTKTAPIANSGPGWQVPAVTVDCSKFDLEAAMMPNPILCAMMSGRTVDLARVENIAKRLEEPEYGLKPFFDDCIAAFPELELFFTEEVYRNLTKEKSLHVSAELSMGDAGHYQDAALEYQRTMGALFAVYWLLRLDMNGKTGFCFGVDEDWQDANGSPGDRRSKNDAQKLADFMKGTNWSYFSVVAELAGLKSLDRVVTMLALTAFHDVMKHPECRPHVQREHSPYMGYSAGEVIGDHDVALAYVLEYFPHLIPSYACLPPASQAAVRLTQCKFNFNHGWFVQAEAPPGAMLTTFKGILASAKSGDVAFYFFHWLTDLAGACGTPLAGCEKLVLKLPPAILTAFLWSIPYLKKLESMPETEVFESYLVARYKEVFPKKTIPEGFTSIAMLRLMTMAQGGAKHIIECYNKLSPERQNFLATEMARSGIEGQRYRCAPVAGGPAFLVYYGPALLQQSQGSEASMQRSLRVLESVYRAGRALWPEAADQEGEVVTLQCESLKSHGIDEVLEGKPGFLWVMVSQGHREARCDQLAASELNALIDAQHQYRVLDFPEEY
eukprot:gb/GFBE01037548.1/.p1 GENE.gb/GFBE01037548.1/~~gb/GFBE01037548.1/.p1  ORF type:complete len:900 (+),score=162.41 gb/GFBE01037548.1/:1-2700(+)